jgi:hypothetical protein
MLASHTYLNFFNCQFIFLGIPTMNKRVRTAFFMILTIVMFMALPILLFAQSKTSMTDALTKDAELIVIGKVGGLVSQWTPDHTRIETRVTVSVDQTLKGSTPGNSLTVVIPGGEVDGVGEWYSHSARFENNEDVVLFAAKGGNGRYHVAGGESGKISIKKDKNTGAKVIPNVGTLDEFTSKIKKSVKSMENSNR